MLRAFLDGHRGDVLSAAEYQLRRALLDKDSPVVFEHLAAFLDEIITELGTESGGLLGEAAIRTDAARHGEQRERLGVDIALVVDDYAVVADIIAGLADQEGMAVSPSEWQKLNRALTVGIAAAITEYCNQRAERDRRQTAEFFGSVAHELRNSLSSVLVAYDALRTGRVALGSHTAEILERQLNQLVTLTNDLMAVSKVNSGIRPVAETIRLRLFVEDMMCSMGIERDIRVDVNVDANLLVLADSRLLTSALMNVVQNAIKFTRRSGTVCIRSQQVQDDVVIEVEDQCGGLSDERADELFAPFVQRHLNRRGLGLGLSIVRKAIEGSGGSINVRNLPGQGCVFTLMLPAPRDVPCLPA